MSQGIDLFHFARKMSEESALDPWVRFCNATMPLVLQGRIEEFLGSFREHLEIEMQKEEPQLFKFEKAFVVIALCVSKASFEIKRKFYREVHQPIYAFFHSENFYCNAFCYACSTSDMDILDWSIFQYFHRWLNNSPIEYTRMFLELEKSGENSQIFQARLNEYLLTN